jgi:hypothetical protein
VVWSVIGGAECERVPAKANNSVEVAEVRRAQQAERLSFERKELSGKSGLLNPTLMAY